MCAGRRSQKLFPHLPRLHHASARRCASELVQLLYEEAPLIDEHDARPLSWLCACVCVCVCARARACSCVRVGVYVCDAPSRCEKEAQTSAMPWSAANEPLNENQAPIHLSPLT